MLPRNACRAIGCVTVLAILVTLLTLHPTASADIPFTEHRTIGYDEHWVESFEVDEGETVYVFFDSNRTADIFIMEIEDYSDYLASSLGNSSFTVIGPWSRLNTTSESYSFRIREDGEYYFIVDNTPLPRSGASSGREVTFFVSVTSMDEPEPIESTSVVWWLPLIIGLILVVVLISLVLVVLATRRREKDPVMMPYSVQAWQMGQEFMTCTSCGNRVPKGRYCAKCGQKLH